ncbi:hypothetical protein RIF24_16375 (plasmid) [Exiguobacterium acetylicum]|uniref:hypothetical protein n=1 Tax=Exiguobacterium acetylicum TaxID=41170 RepID=UPI0039773FAC
MTNPNWYKGSLKNWKAINGIKKEDGFIFQLLSRKVAFFEKRFSYPDARTHAVLRLCIENVGDIDFVVTPKQKGSTETDYKITINGEARPHSRYNTLRLKNYSMSKTMVYLSTIVEHVHSSETALLKKMVQENISLDCVHFFERRVHQYTTDTHSFSKTSIQDPELYMGEILKGLEYVYGRNYLLNLNSSLICVLDTSSEEGVHLNVLDVYNCKRVPIILAKGLVIPKDMESIKKIVIYNLALVWSNIREDFIEPYRVESLDYKFDVALDNPVFCVPGEELINYRKLKLSLHEMATSIQRNNMQFPPSSLSSTVVSNVVRASENILSSLNEYNTDDPFMIVRADSVFDGEKGHSTFVELKRQYQLKVSDFDGDYQKMIKDYLFRCEDIVRSDYKDRDISRKKYDDYMVGCSFIKTAMAEFEIKTRQEYLTCIASTAEQASKSEELNVECKENIRHLITYMI